MRNGTLSNLNKLVLVTIGGKPNSDREDAGDADMAYTGSFGKPDDIVTEELRKSRNTLIVFMTVSIACMTAAIATGSYAIWLSRHRAAHQALTDVNDLLKSCQARMQKLEEDIQRLP